MRQFVTLSNHTYTLVANSEVMRLCPSVDRLAKSLVGSQLLTDNFTQLKSGPRTQDRLDALGCEIHLASSMDSLIVNANDHERFGDFRRMLPPGRSTAIFSCNERRGRSEV